jgi:putative ABC transport system substrate-binding protein
MRRRNFMSLIGGAVAWPLAARAQQPGQIARIGVLNVSSDNPVSGLGYQAFIVELRKLGFTEGQDLVIEYRRTDQGAELAFAGAVEMVRLNVEVIVASGPEFSLKAAIAASPTIPIVMLANSYDPIVRGYVASLARPGGNITGLFYRQPELAQKRVELLTQTFPEMARLGVLWDAISAEQFAAIERTAKSLNLELQSVKFEESPDDLDAAFQTLVERNSQMLLVLTSNRFTSARSRIAELAKRHRLPSMFPFKIFAEAGGLMSYGIDVVPMWRRAASSVAKILRGAKPADLPVEQATNFELVVNLRTAKAIGIELPASILLRADEVIE